MRIVIDMQGAQTDSRFRGIGRYSLALSQAIAKHAGHHEVWLVVNARFPDSLPAIRVAFDGLVPASRIRTFDVPTSNHKGKWLTLASEVVREDFVASLAPDVVLLTSVFEGYHSSATTSVDVQAIGVPTAAILYDLIPLLNQEQYLPSSDLREYYFRKIGWMKQANLLLAISESSRQEGMLHLGRTGEQVINISTAVGSQFQPRVLSPDERSGFFARLGIARKMVMYAPGGFDPRKNFARLIEAYSLLPDDLKAQHQLVIVSKLNPPQREELDDLRVRHGLRRDELVLPGYVDDEDLIALYSIADLFVFPSLHEGFGLPVLEAMACGAIVIGSNSTSVPEVIGLEEALFDPMSVDSICKKLTEALTDDGLRASLRRHGQQQVKKFSWDTSAIQAIKALETLHARTGAQREKMIHRPPIISSLAELRHTARPTDAALRMTAQCLAFNSVPDQPQFLLDISSLVQSDAKSGIQRVVRSLLAEFLTNPPAGFNAQPIYFDGNDYRYAGHFSASVTGTAAGGADTVVDFWQDDIYLSLDLIMHLTPRVHAFHTNLVARGIKFYFIVYDILLAQHPEWWPEGTATQFDVWLRSISTIATGLICISRAVEYELEQWLAAHPPARVEHGPMIGSFHLGADVRNSLPSRGMPSTSARVLEQTRSRTSFVMVSTIEPRKGYAQALTAFELLWAKGHDVNLIIVGKRGWLVEETTRRLASHSENDQRLFWLEGISDEYLERVYQESQCLIAASEGEGFGLPLIEAAQHKLPIIARDIPVFREVAGGHAYYFQADQPAELAQAIESWLVLYKADQHPKSNNMPWLTWRESAAQLSKALNLPAATETPINELKVTH